IQGDVFSSGYIYSQPPLLSHELIHHISLPFKILCDQVEMPRRISFEHHCLLQKLELCARDQLQIRTDRMLRFSSDAQIDTSANNLTRSQKEFMNGIINRHYGISHIGNDHPPTGFPSTSAPNHQTSVSLEAETKPQAMFSSVSQRGASFFDLLQEGYLDHSYYGISDLLTIWLFNEVQHFSLIHYYLASMALSHSYTLPFEAHVVKVMNLQRFIRLQSCLSDARKSVSLSIKDPTSSNFDAPEGFMYLSACFDCGANLLREHRQLCGEISRDVDTLENGIWENLGVANSSRHQNVFVLSELLCREGILGEFINLSVRHEIEQKERKREAKNTKLIQQYDGHSSKSRSEMLPNRKGIIGIGGSIAFPLQGGKRSIFYSNSSSTETSYTMEGNEEQWWLQQQLDDETEIISRTGSCEGNNDNSSSSNWNESPKLGTSSASLHSSLAIQQTSSKKQLLKIRGKDSKRKRNPHSNFFVDPFPKHSIQFPDHSVFSLHSFHSTLPRPTSGVIVVISVVALLIIFSLLFKCLLLYVVVLKSVDLQTLVQERNVLLSKTLALAHYDATLNEFGIEPNNISLLVQLAISSRISHEKVIDLMNVIKSLHVVEKHPTVYYSLEKLDMLFHTGFIVPSKSTHLSHGSRVYDGRMKESNSGVSDEPFYYSPTRAPFLSVFEDRRKLLTSEQASAKLSSDPALVSSSKVVSVLNGLVEATHLKPGQVEHLSQLLIHHSLRSSFDPGALSIVQSPRTSVNDSLLSSGSKEYHMHTLFPTPLSTSSMYDQAIPHHALKESLLNLSSKHDEEIARVLTGLMSALSIVQSPRTSVNDSLLSSGSKEYHMQTLFPTPLSTSSMYDQAIPHHALKESLLNLSSKHDEEIARVLTGLMSNTFLENPLLVRHLLQFEGYLAEEVVVESVIFIHNIKVKSPSCLNGVSVLSRIENEIYSSCILHNILPLDAECQFEVRNGSYLVLNLSSLSASTVEFIKDCALWRGNRCAIKLIDKTQGDENNLLRNLFSNSFQRNMIHSQLPFGVNQNAWIFDQDSDSYDTFDGQGYHHSQRIPDSLHYEMSDVDDVDDEEREGKESEKEEYSSRNSYDSSQYVSELETVKAWRRWKFTEHDKVVRREKYAQSLHLCCSKSGSTFQKSRMTMRHSSKQLLSESELSDTLQESEDYQHQFKPVEVHSTALVLPEKPIQDVISYPFAVFMGNDKMWRKQMMKYFKLFLFARICSILLCVFDCHLNMTVISLVNFLAILLIGNVKTMSIMILQALTFSKSVYDVVYFTSLHHDLQSPEVSCLETQNRLKDFMAFSPDGIASMFQPILDSFATIDVYDSLYPFMHQLQESSIALVHETTIGLFLSALNTFSSDQSLGHMWRNSHAVDHIRYALNVIGPLTNYDFSYIHPDLPASLRRYCTSSDEIKPTTWEINELCYPQSSLKKEKS
ncbi:hypothetical protein ADUPG1_007009, partial [Aduncisulcus paluster]